MNITLEIGWNMKVVLLLWIAAWLIREWWVIASVRGRK